MEFVECRALAGYTSMRPAAVGHIISDSTTSKKNRSAVTALLIFGVPAHRVSDLWLAG